MPPSPAESVYRLRTSPLLGVAIALAAVGGVASAAASTVPVWWLAILVVSAPWMSVSAWTTQVSRHGRHAVIALGRDIDGEWWLQTRDGPPCTAHLLHVCTHPLAIFIVWAAADRRLAVVIGCDALSGDRYRQLCVLLRTASLEPAAARTRDAGVKH